MSIPTRGEVYSQLLEHLVKSQEACAMMAHLHRTEDTQIDRTLAHGWLGISELLKKMQHKVTQMAMGRMN
jgi:hypothetical protein